MLATMAEEAFTGAPATSFALIAASSKAPRSFAACCARTASIAFAVCDLSFATFVRLPLPLCHRLQVLSAVRQRVVAGVVSHDHDRGGLARRLPVDRASQKSPKVAASRNHPPAVPAVPQLALISLLTHL